MGAGCPAILSLPAPEPHGEVFYRVLPVSGSCPKNGFHHPVEDLREKLEKGLLLESGRPSALLDVRLLGIPRPAISPIAAPPCRAYLEVQLEMGRVSSL